jgi:hypothetical protein
MVFPEPGSNGPVVGDDAASLNKVDTVNAYGRLFRDHLTVTKGMPPSKRKQWDRRGTSVLSTPATKKRTPTVTHSQEFVRTNPVTGPPLEP